MGRLRAARIGWRVTPGAAERTVVWSRVGLTAVGVGALAGAGQLGVAYGLGLVWFAREFPNDGDWSAQLTWVAWFAALAVLGGAGAATWAARRQDVDLQMGARVGVSLAAGLGAAIVVPLTALPADSATVLGRDLPAAGAAVAAGVGVLVGIAASITMLSTRLVAVSVTLLVAVVWALALVSVVPWLTTSGDLPRVRLGVLDLPAVGGGDQSTVAVLGPPVLALLSCGAIAAAARSRGLPPLPAALASTAAPGLLALVYLIGGPGTGDRAVQTSPYAASLIAVAVGLLVSLLVGVVRLPSARGLAPEPAGHPPEWHQEPAGAGRDEEPGTAPAESAQPPEPGTLAEPGESTGWDITAEPAAGAGSRPESRIAPPAWARFTDPPEPAEPPTPPSPERPVSAPPAWPEPAFPLPPPAPIERGPARPARSDPAPHDPAPRFSSPEPAVPPVVERPATRKPPAPAPRPGPSEVTAPAPAPPPPEVAEPEPLPEVAEPEPLPEKPARRLRVPRRRRRSAPDAEQPAPPAEPEPEPAVDPAPSPSTAAPEPPPSPAPPKPGRRGEAEHLDWISSLAGASDEEEEPATGRRRLRQDRDPGGSPETFPEPPTRPGAR